MFIINMNDASIVDSDLLVTFLAVADHRNVTHAANALGRTQSAISIQIRKLEERLGASLFQRQPRGVTLTEEGQRLVPAARRVAQELGSIGAMFAEPLTGRLRLGIPGDYNVTALEAVLAAFAARHPGVEVSVHSGYSIGYPAAIRSGDLDLALYTAHPGEDIGEVLLAEDTVWAAGERYRFDPREPVPLALFERQCWWHDIAVKAMEQARQSYRIAYSSENAVGVMAAISAGLAVGVLNESAVTDGMRRLAGPACFSPLPQSRLLLLEGDRIPADLSAAMKDALRAAVRAPARAVTRQARS